MKSRSTITALILSLVLSTFAFAQQDITVRDEGTVAGRARELNITGPGVSASVSSGIGRIDVPSTACTAYLAPGTNGLQAAIDALATTGGVLCLSTGTYVQTGSPISIGDGSTSALATRHGVKIIGVAIPATGMLQSFTGATIIDCTGTTASNCFGINGSEGIAMENLVINGGVSGADPTGIRITSGRWGAYKNLYINGFKKGLHVTTWATFSPGGNWDSIGNIFEGISIKQGTGATQAIHLDGANANANADFNSFRRISILPANSSTCIELGWADGNVFENVHCFGGGTSVTGLKFEYGGPNDPADNYFYGLELATYGIVNSGAPGSLGANYIYGYSEANSGVCPDVANLHVFGCTIAVAQDLKLRGKIKEYNDAAITDGQVLIGHTANGTFEKASLTAGSNVTITPSAGGITIASSGGASGDFLTALSSAEIAITGATTATISRMHVASGTSADYTITLPNCASAGTFVGLRMAPLASLSKLVTIDGDGGDTIDGALTRVMWAGESATLLCDGTNWFKIAGRSIPMMATMHLSANQTGIVTATMTKVLLDATDTDNTGVMTNIGSNRIDIKRAGFYDVFGIISIEILSSAQSKRNLVVLRKDDTQIAFSESYTEDGYPTTPVGSKISWALGENVSIAGYHTKGSNAVFVGGTLAAGAAQLSVVEIPQW